MEKAAVAAAANISTAPGLLYCIHRSKSCIHQHTSPKDETTPVDKAAAVAAAAAAVAAAADVSAAS